MKILRGENGHSTTAGSEPQRPDAPLTRESVAGQLHRALLRAEKAIDRGKRSVRRRLGLLDPETIMPYRGWSNGRVLRLGGRVLSDPPLRELDADARWWENLADTWRRWETDEVPGAEVQLTLPNLRQQTTMSDDEGHLRFEVHLADRIGGPFYQAARMELLAVEGLDDAPSLTTSAEFIQPDERAEFGVISDMDDTVIRTGITDLLTAARLTFLENAQTRKPFPGVAELYRALHTGGAELGGEPTNPVFYISSSAWNLYDLLDGFLKFNDIPRGPILLQDLGLTENRLFKAGHARKVRDALKIMGDFPHLPFLLFGDSGQQDAELYADIAERHSERVKAIVIRDVDPQTASERDERVREHIQRAKSVGVPMWLVPDSGAAAEHLAGLGLVSDAAVEAIHVACDDDRAAAAA